LPSAAAAALRRFTLRYAFLFPAVLFFGFARLLLEGTGMDFVSNMPI
jgi:hypothetical protein